FVEADNDSGRIEVHRTVESAGLEVLIGIPEGELDKSSVRREAFAPLIPASRRARELALSGRYWEAMTVNGLVVAAALGQNSSPAAAALRSGALGAGITGMGPAVAAVVPEGAVTAVERALKSHGLRVAKYRVENRPGIWYEV
ncbi:MAG: hypothetical protein ACP5NG_03300, partial [Conexivisphaera sp.]